MRKVSAVLITLAILPAIGSAQPGGIAIRRDATVEFVSMEIGAHLRLVKGAPYSADSTTESVQNLADGNRIIRKNSASIARDGEGRTRHEHTITAVGPFAASGEPHRSAVINDPVSGVHYILDLDAKTARKITLPPGVEGFGMARFESFVGRRAAAGAVAGIATERAVRMGHPHPHPSPGSVMGNAQNVNTESLGKQIMEGVQVEGTRTTMTIPAGEAGNERPIEIVSERWYSPELQATVFSKHNDPRFGETTQRLTNIRRIEPLRSLFEVPVDFTVQDAPAPPMHFMRKKKE